MGEKEISRLRSRAARDTARNSLLSLNIAAISKNISLARIFHEHYVKFLKIADISIYYTGKITVLKDSKCSPKVSSCGVIFFSLFAVNIVYYYLMQKTSNLTPPELMKYPG